MTYPCYSPSQNSHYCMCSCHHLCCILLVLSPCCILLVLSQLCVHIVCKASHVAELANFYAKVFLFLSIILSENNSL